MGKLPCKLFPLGTIEVVEHFATEHEVKGALRQTGQHVHHPQRDLALVLADLLGARDGFVADVDAEGRALIHVTEEGPDADT